MSVAAVVTCKYVIRAISKSLCWVPWRPVGVSWQRPTSLRWGPMTGLQNAEFVSKADVRLRCVLHVTVHYYMSCFPDQWLLGKWLAEACFSVSFMCHSRFMCNDVLACATIIFNVWTLDVFSEVKLLFPQHQCNVHQAWFVRFMFIFLIFGRCVLMSMSRFETEPKCVAPMWWRTPMWGQLMRCAWNHNVWSAAMCWKVTKCNLSELSHFHVMLVTLIIPLCLAGFWDLSMFSALNPFFALWVFQLWCKFFTT